MPLPAIMHRGEQAGTRDEAFSHTSHVRSYTLNTVGALLDCLCGSERVFKAFCVMLNMYGMN